MNGFKRYAVFRGGTLNYRNVFCIERALTCVIKNVSVKVCMRMLCTLFKLRSFFIPAKGKIPELDPVVCLIAYRKPFVFQILRIRQKRLFLFTGQNTKAFSSFRFTVLDTRSQKIARIPVALERTGYPQTVDISITFRIYWIPCVLCRQIFYKTLPALNRFQKYKPVVKTVCKPCFF